MTVSRLKTWSADEILTADDLNGEFNNILNNQQLLGTPRSAAFDMNGMELILDADADTSITADTDDQIDIRINGADVFVLNATTMTGPTGVLATAQVTTSGTSKDFTITAWAKEVDIEFVGVSLDNTDQPLIQLGDIDGIEATGYLGGTGQIDDTSPTVTRYTTGFGIRSVDAGNVLHGKITLSLENAAAFTWVASGNIAASNADLMFSTAGSKSLSAALTTVRIVSTGTANFDAGAINVIYR